MREAKIITNTAHRCASKENVRHINRPKRAYWTLDMKSTSPAYIAYLRVSTSKQGESGLGLEAQRESVRRCVGDAVLIAEFVEIESGKRADRVELAKALAECRRTGATLIVAKLDRLSRNLKFLATMLEGDVKFIAADNPSANELTLGILSVVAQAEARMISERTKAALAAAKARGVKLGGTYQRPFGEAEQARGRASIKAGADTRADALMPVLDDLRAAGVTSFGGLARGLTERGVKTARGGEWTAMQVKRVMERRPC